MRSRGKGGGGGQHCLFEGSVDSLSNYRPRFSGLSVLEFSPGGGGGGDDMEDFYPDVCVEGFSATRGLHWCRRAITIALVLGSVTPTLVPICYK